MYIYIYIYICYLVSGSHKTWFLENRKNPFGPPIRIPCSCGYPMRVSHSDTWLMRIRMRISFGNPFRKMDPNENLIRIRIRKMSFLLRHQLSRGHVLCCGDVDVKLDLQLPGHKRKALTTSIGLEIVLRQQFSRGQVWVVDIF